MFSIFCPDLDVFYFCGHKYCTYGCLADKVPSANINGDFKDLVQTQFQSMTIQVIVTKLILTLWYHIGPKYVKYVKDL